LLTATLPAEGVAASPRLLPEAASGAHTHCVWRCLYWAAHYDCSPLRWEIRRRCAEKIVSLKLGLVPDPKSLGCDQGRANRVGQVMSIWRAQLRNATTPALHCGQDGAVLDLTVSSSRCDCNGSSVRGTERCSVGGNSSSSSSSNKTLHGTHRAEEQGCKPTASTHLRLNTCQSRKQ